MQRAMDETARRRSKQIEHNTKHGITPKGIIKSVADIMEGAYAGQGNNKRGKKVAEGLASYAISTEAPLTLSNMPKELKRLEEKMYQHARDLEFEEAAQIRGQIGKLKLQMLAS